MKYPLILFDLDSTLLDTNLNAEKALQKMPIAQKFSFNSERLAYWHVLNNSLWQQYESNQITKDQLFDQRFKRYFQHFDVQVDTSPFQDQFIKLFAQEHELMPHAVDLLDSLSDHQLYVISNGTKFKQQQQIKGANIGSYFRKVILSEYLGYKKPDPKFFQSMSQVIGDNDFSDMLVVGDSLSADIQGANRAGIDSVWYNPSKSVNKGSQKPTYEVDDLLQIQNILR
ncbi:YjjG family noncanonical pyrimidine nucleotidase [Companilactobacillus versmoldensis]|uniref:HAD superfamily hydrolase n=1 Tax=Companilactobacillus versmoldensis DSM 14857 = KCTC 3814 TaxID=1423815 RepID=A0A0R1SBY2_9LACO|nr:YjjG family noncanonical pyrimidine nucleotidase [Companilactobacillus versmoldensis]KRL66647.1 HAD superfamily hydrolase [Companilactobacillus versmoldensis DSM 14857 = KCTC 3814]